MSGPVLLMAGHYKAVCDYARLHGLGSPGRDWHYVTGPGSVQGRRAGRCVLIRWTGMHRPAWWEDVVDLLEAAGFELVEG